MKAYEQTLSFLSTLNLKGIANSLDEMVHDAEINKTSYITFLNTLFTTEISYRVNKPPPKGGGLSVRLFRFLSKEL